MGGIRTWREECAAFLELFAISGIAIAQPALDLLGKNASVFVSERAQTPDILVLVALILFVPPAAAYVIELAVALLYAKARPIAHGVLAAVFFGVFVEETMKQASSVRGMRLAALGVVAGIVAVVLVARYMSVRRWMRVLAVAPIIFVVTFLAFTPVSSIVFGSQPKGLAGAAVTKPKRVVMIAMDEFPLESLLDGTGHVDASLFPNFAALAQTTTWYRNDTSVAPFTEWAVPALDTGQYPSQPNAVPTSTDYKDTVFRLLGGAYRMHVHESITELCPTSICNEKTSSGGTASRVGKLVKVTSNLWRGFASVHNAPPVSFAPLLDNPPQFTSAEQWLRTLTPSTKPTFDYLHVLLPHQPWRYLPTLQDTGYNPQDPFTITNLISWIDTWSADVGKEKHVLQLEAGDRLLGQIIAKLKAIGAWDNSVVVVTADHGIAFEAHQPARSVVASTADQILWTPLFVKTPQQTTGRIDDRPAQSVDVVPTIADLIGLKIPWHVDGVSLEGPPRKEFVRHFYQWRLPHFQPKDLKVAPGNTYMGFDPRVYFPEVLKARAAPPGDDPALRPYQIGPYASLLGKHPDAYLDAERAGAGQVPPREHQEAGARGGRCARRLVHMARGLRVQRVRRPADGVHGQRHDRRFRRGTQDHRHLHDGLLLGARLAEVLQGRRERRARVRDLRVVVAPAPQVGATRQLMAEAAGVPGP